MAPEVDTFPGCARTGLRTRASDGDGSVSKLYETKNRTNFLVKEFLQAKGGRKPVTEVATRVLGAGHLHMRHVAMWWLGGPLAGLRCFPSSSRIVIDVSNFFDFFRDGKFVFFVMQ